MTTLVIGPTPAICMTAQNVQQTADIVSACNAYVMQIAIIFTILGAIAAIAGITAAWLILRKYPDFPDYFVKP